jgi:hypothetical protein
MKNCFDMKKECPFRATDPTEAHCPAYAVQVSCWEFDWLGFYSAMPDGAKKDEWKRMMLVCCSDREIPESFSEEVDSFLAKLKRV